MERISSELHTKMLRAWQETRDNSGADAITVLDLLSKSK